MDTKPNEENAKTKKKSIRKHLEELFSTLSAIRASLEIIPQLVQFYLVLSLLRTLQCSEPEISRAI